MQMTYRIISADAHIEVPPDQWAGRVPVKFRDMAPKRIRLPNGGDGFLVEGGIYQGGMNLCAGKSPDDFSPIGLKWDEMPGTGTPQQRLAEQDTDGIDAEVLYPGVGGVRGITRGIQDDEAYTLWSAPTIAGCWRTTVQRIRSDSSAWGVSRSGAWRLRSRRSSTALTLASRPWNWRCSLAESHTQRQRMIVSGPPWWRWRCR